MSMFEVSKPFPDKRPGVAIANPTAEQLAFLRRAMSACRMDDPAYVARQSAGAFLQCDSSHYVFVEFWKDDYDTFVDYLNQDFRPWVARAREWGLLPQE